MELLDLLGVAANAAVIDVGGGASTLVDRLLDRGFSDVTVLDQSPAALNISQQRVGEGRPVAWIVHELLSWAPERRYDLWHDRAVLHFLAGAEIDTYLMLLDRALATDGAIILGAFAPDGPQECSGLTTRRYAAGELALLLGARFEVVAQRRELHHTPGGVVQSFTWIAARRKN
jgi:trans-aconitate methyltransferase